MAVCTDDQMSVLSRLQRNLKHVKIKVAVQPVPLLCSKEIQIQIQIRIPKSESSKTILEADEGHPLVFFPSLLFHPRYCSHTRVSSPFAHPPPQSLFGWLHSLPFPFAPLPRIYVSLSHVQLPFQRLILQLVTYTKTAALSSSRVFR